jgi:hypothetical protein
MKMTRRKRVKEMKRVKLMKMNKVRVKKKAITGRKRQRQINPQESDETSEEPRPSRSKMTRELRAQGTKQPEIRKKHQE